MISDFCRPFGVLVVLELDCQLTLSNDAVWVALRPLCAHDNPVERGGPPLPNQSISNPRKLSHFAPPVGRVQWVLCSFPLSGHRSPSGTTDDPLRSKLPCLLPACEVWEAWTLPPGGRQVVSSK